MKNLVAIVFILFGARLSLAESTPIFGGLGLSCNRYSAEGCYDPKATFDFCNYRNVKTSEGEFIEYHLKESTTNSNMTFRISTELPSEDHGVVAKAVAVSLVGLPQHPSFFCMAPHSQQYLPHHYWICYGGEPMNVWGDTLEFSLQDNYCSVTTSIDETVQK